MVSTGNVGRNEGRLYLVFCCSACNMTWDGSAGVERRMSVCRPPGFPESVTYGLAGGCAGVGGLDTVMCEAR